MNKNVFFDGSMDQECIAICNAVDSLPGCKIVCSCCGHDKEPYEIVFTCSNAASLNIIVLAAKIIDNPRYRQLEWSCNVWSSSTAARIPLIGIPFGFKSTTEYSLISASIGPAVYAQANSIARTITALAKKSNKALHKLHDNLKNRIDG
jgi:hypothetical protein